jgi:glucosamine--fructose-6-phosphate aminotransferase (isomerizing)
VCGIVGAISRDGAVLAGLIEGLRVLEYRGYDSCGVAVADGASVSIRRKVGRLPSSSACSPTARSPKAKAGIGHTRWATHGKPSDENAHPHSDGSGRMALVHNGIIENYLELRRELTAEGRMFTLRDRHRGAVAPGRPRARARQDARRCRARRAAARARLLRVAVMLAGSDRRLVGARQGPPLVVAKTDSAYLASDVLALLPHTRDVVYLEDGDVAELAPGSS